MATELVTARGLRVTPVCRQVSYQSKADIRGGMGQRHHQDRVRLPSETVQRHGLGAQRHRQIHPPLQRASSAHEHRV